MRNYHEEIPPWKKEVLMRRDGLSKAVEQDLSLLNLCDSVSTSSSSRQVDSVKNTRYGIGFDHSANANSYCPIEKRDRLRSNGRISSATSNKGIFFQTKFE